MVNTEPILPNPNHEPSRVSSGPNELVPPPSTDQLTQQLSHIVAKLSHVDADISELKKQNVFPSEPKIVSMTVLRGVKILKSVLFPKFEGGDPHGWIMEAEKYFRYYQTPEELKVDVAANNLEGDALDIFIWVSSRSTIRFWEELTQILKENFCPAEFQKPDVYLCSIKQTGTVNEYRQEFARRCSRAHGWPQHCLLGVFINGLREELQSDVKIHKPRTVYKAARVALEFEAKLQSQHYN